MKLEHFAINVEEPQAMSAWYQKHLGLKVVKEMKEAPFMTFLADDSGMIMIEIYCNSKAPVPDYHHQHPLVAHLAFVSGDPKADKSRLIAAGASEITDDVLEDGSHLVMLKDPWGLAIQLCKRAQPMLKDQ